MTEFDFEEIIMVGDQHIGRYNNSNEHFQNNLDYYDFFLFPIIKKKLKENKKFIIWFTGDETDNKQLISNYFQSVFMDKVEEMVELSDTELIISTGNHSCSNKNDLTHSSIKPLGKLKNVTIVVNTPVIWTNKQGKKCAFISWFNSVDKLKEIIQELKTQNVNHVFGHNEIEGFWYEGLKIEGNYITIDELKEFESVNMGHVHGKQSIQNCHFVGSALHTKTKEHKNIVGVTILNVNNNTREFIENRISPRYKRYTFHDFVNTKINDLLLEIKNNYVTILTPLNLTEKINFVEIVKPLSGYRNLEFKPNILNDNQDSEEVDTIIDIKNEDFEIDLKLLYNEYIDGLERVLVDKQVINVKDGLKITLKDNFTKLYSKSEENLKSILDLD